MSEEMPFIEDRRSVTSERGQLPWKHFLFNVQAVRELAGLVDTDKVKQALQSGLAYQGSGWNVATASRTLFETCGGPLNKRRLGKIPTSVSVRRGSVLGSGAEHSRGTNRQRG